MRKNAAAALTPLEEIVAGIWCEVLRLPSVGRNENFFNLGGHSLLVTQVLSRMREYLKVELPIRSHVRSTDSGRDVALDPTRRSMPASSTKSYQRSLQSLRDGELPLSYSQQRMWFFEQLASGTSAFHIALGVRLTRRAEYGGAGADVERDHAAARKPAHGISGGESSAGADHSATNALSGCRSLTMVVREEERERQAARLAQAETMRAV